MMCKAKKGVFFLLIAVLFFCLMPGKAIAAEPKTEEAETLPSGDILIMYSENISDEDMENVKNLVEELTYQSMQVAFAPASDCLGHLREFEYILCYKIERFPKGIIEELMEREEKGNRLLETQKREGFSLDEENVRIMFIGNRFLRSYLKQTGREDLYIDSAKGVGKLQYSFSDYEQQERLVREDDFLFLTGELDETSGSITVEEKNGYFSARMGSLYHIAVSDLTDNLVRAAVSKEVSLWKWPYNGEPHVYAQYMVLNKVYPFQNPDKLLAIINYMIEREEPFVISVMPVYNNGNYPAMQHFCEVLRYAQANGGVILMHSPINQMPDFDADLVNDYITTAVNIYIEQGVYPMGLQVPVNWLFNDETIEVISRFRTVLVSEEEDPLIEWEENLNTNTVYKDGHQWIAPAIQLNVEGISHLKTYSTAVCFDITEETERIERKVQACIESEVPLKSLWDIEHSFWTDDDVMTYRNHIILLNGKRTDRTFTATEYDEKFEYNRNMLQRFSKDLSEENRKLVVVVVTVSALFLWFILLARHKNKQRFFVRKNTKERSARFENDMTIDALEKQLFKREESTWEGLDPECRELEDFDIKELKENEDFDYD